MASVEQPTSRRYAHSEGVTRLRFDRHRHLVTCGHDCDVRTFSGIDEDDSSEFTVSTETISAIVPYILDGRDLVAVAIDNHTVQSYTREGTPEGLLVRCTRPITYLSVDPAHLRLAAGSCDFTIRTVRLDDITQVGCLRGHEAPVLCSVFDPQGQLLASTSCDGSVRVWDLENGNTCVKVLNILHKSNDISTAKSLATVAWQPTDGKLLAVPVETEVRVYERGSWDCLATLQDHAHKEAVNVVSWSGCGQFLSCAGVDGVASVWDFPTKSVTGRFQNESAIGITSLEWYPDMKNGDSEQESKRGLYFADKEGYIGWFQGAWPASGRGSTRAESSDPLADDSLLMEGIPPDAIFGTDDDIIDEALDDRNDDNLPQSGSHGNTPDEDDIIHSRKRRRLLEESDGETDSAVAAAADDDGESLVSGDVGHTHSQAKAPPTSRSSSATVFSDKMLEVYQSPLLPSSTPHTLTHHFLVYNMVGVVRSHNDNNTPMIEVEFHNSNVHHAFSLPNHHGNNMASLSESCLVLACQRNEGNPSQVQCIHFTCWDSPNKEWSISLPAKESATGLSLGNGWIAVATDKQLLRVFSLGGIQCDVISVAGVIVGVAGWGSRLAVVLQEPPCTEKVFHLKVWVVDVVRRKQLSHPHTLPLSLHSQLEWFGFSEGGRLVSYDTKGIVRILDSAHYGGLSWIPILDTTKHLGSKADHYFLTGMTHGPEEIRAVLCKGLRFPTVHPKPVMTVLPLQLPLCDPSSEKTQLEDKYLQEVLLRNDSVARAQALMKMFALSCKSDQSYRALETAQMMDDQMTLNLALMYASRTQHHTLARHVSDLISNQGQQTLSEEEEVSDCDNENDAIYLEHRASALRQREQLGNGTKTGPAGSKPVRLAGLSSLKMKNGGKVDRNPEKPRRNILNSAHHSTAMKDGSNLAEEEEGEEGEREAAGEMTKELFSDKEEEEEGGEEDMEQREGESRRPLLTPTAGTKRPNPFKMTTPETRRVQTERKSSFLDNVGQRTQRQIEEEREVKLRKQRETGTGRRTKAVKMKRPVSDKKLQGSLKVAKELAGGGVKEVKNKEGGSLGVKTTTDVVAKATKQKLDSFSHTS